MAKTWLSGFESRMRAAIASVRQCLLRAGSAAVKASTPRRASARR
jgi:hypothetical protein